MSMIKNPNILVIPPSGDRGRRVKHVNFGVGRTKQSFKDACDINKIVGRAIKTGFLNHCSTQVPSYGDYSNVPDYQTSIDIVSKANGQFSALPSEIRKRFDNDPVKFLDFVGDIKNKEEAMEIGLIPKPPVPPPVPPPPAV